MEKKKEDEEDEEEDEREEDIIIIIIIIIIIGRITSLGFFSFVASSTRNTRTTTRLKRA